MKKLWLLLVVIALGGCKMNNDSNSEVAEVSNTSNCMYTTIINGTDKDLQVSYRTNSITLAPNASEVFTTNLDNIIESASSFCFLSYYGSMARTLPSTKKANTEYTMNITKDSFKF